MATTQVTSVSSTTTSTQLVAADVTRSGLVFANTDAYRLYLLQGDGTASATNYTTYLDEGDVAEIDGDEAEQEWNGVWDQNGAGQVNITETLTEQLGGAGETSILGILQEIAPRIGLSVPSAVFAATDQTALELKRVANSALWMVARAHRWQKLVQRATYTGDGSTEDFDLPDDFGWMPDDQNVWSSELKNPMSKVVSLDDWLGMDVQDFNPGVNAWIIYGQQMHILPALTDGTTAQHYYQSTAAVQPATGTAKSNFTLDTDTFRLDDELLRLAIIYRWKQDKGLPYAEFLQDYEILKEKLIARDKGATSLRQGAPRMPRGVNVAYPLNVPLT